MNRCGAPCIHVQVWPAYGVIVQELFESGGGRPNEPSGFRGRKAVMNHASALVSACP